MWRRDPEKYQEWLRKERDAEKPKFLYQDLEDESDDEHDEPELEDIANEIREEENCIQILKWINVYFNHVQLAFSLTSFCISAALGY